jgi:type IV secretion system protein TrbL
MNGLTVLDTIHLTANHGYLVLSHFAHVIFILLAVIQFSLMISIHLISQRNISELWGALGKAILTTAIFYLLMTEAATWSYEFLTGVITLGRSVNPALTDPSPWGLVQFAARISAEITQAASGRGMFSNIGLTLLALFFAFFIMIVMGLMAADLAVTYGKFYIVIGVSAILVALGALEVTREIAKNYYKALIGLGLQLLVTFFLLAVFYQMSAQWSGMFYQYAQDLNKISGIWTIPMEILIFYMLMKTVPPWIAGLSGVGGFQNHGETTVMIAAAVAAQSAKSLSPANHINTIKEKSEQYKSAGFTAAKATTALGRGAFNAATNPGGTAINAAKSVGSGIKNIVSGAQGNASSSPSVAKSLGEIAAKRVPKKP